MAKSTDKAPYFPFYVKDYETDEHVKLMSLAQEGAFLRLLSLQWLHRSIPSSTESLARVCRVTHDEFLTLWPGVSPCFTAAGDGRLINEKMERTRSDQAAFSRQQSRKGRKSVEVRTRLYGTPEPRIGSRTNDEPVVRGRLEPTTNQTTNQARTSGSQPVGTNDEPASALAFASAKKEEEQPHLSSRTNTARPESVCAGSLPRDHVSHALCDDRFSWCVPMAVHDHLAQQLAPKYGGDRQAAKSALKAWYPTIWAKLQPDFVMGDAFKFWRPHFDVAFVKRTDVPKPESNVRYVPTFEESKARREAIFGKQAPS